MAMGSGTIIHIFSVFAPGVTRSVLNFAAKVTELDVGVLGAIATKTRATQGLLRRFRLQEVIDSELS